MELNGTFIVVEVPLRDNCNQHNTLNGRHTTMRSKIDTLPLATKLLQRETLNIIKRHTQAFYVPTLINTTITHHIIFIYNIKEGLPIWPFKTPLS